MGEMREGGVPLGFVWRDAIADRRRFHTGEPSTGWRKAGGAIIVAHANLRATTRNSPSPVLGFWDKDTRGGAPRYKPPERFGHYQDPGISS